MPEQPKQSVTATIKNFANQHKTKFLVMTTVASTAYAVVARAGIAQHNEFLKQHDLYEQFYELTPEA